MQDVTFYRAEIDYRREQLVRNWKPTRRGKRRWERRA